MKRSVFSVTIMPLVLFFFIGCSSGNQPNTTTGIKKDSANVGKGIGKFVNIHLTH